MFHALHRIYVLGWIIVVCGALVWLYPRSGVSEPLLDWYAVWSNQPETSVTPVGELSGAVVKVLDGVSFTMLAEDKKLYNVALLGAMVPRSRSHPADVDLTRRAKEGLAGMVLSNEVRVTLTWIDPQRRGVGVVHLGRTNVNAAMVQAGFVEFKRESIKGLPLLDQYTLVRADRRSKSRKTADAAPEL